MTRLRFKYYMKLSFSGLVEKHRFSLKCIPESDENQRIFLSKKEVYPNSFISEGTDSFGNVIIYGYEESSHKYFFFDVEGEAETGLKTENIEKQSARVNIFKYQTDITRPGKSILGYYEELTKDYKLSPDDSVSFAEYVMNRLGTDYSYVSGVTDIQTKAENAMQCGKGVCQDFSHIMLSICRIRKIPCRYVTGMMLGEGKSHAWVEVYSGDRWIGMDPTNSQLVGDYYIKIAHGRDYRDCLVNQGVFTGDVLQNQVISVSVEEIE